MMRMVSKTSGRVAELLDAAERWGSDADALERAGVLELFDDASIRAERIGAMRRVAANFRRLAAAQGPGRA